MHRLTRQTVNKQTQKALGLTLLELILVLFLLGLVLSVVVGTLPENRNTTLNTQNAQFKKGFASLLNEARLEGRFYGLSVTQRDWQWMRTQVVNRPTSTEALDEQRRTVASLVWEAFERRHLVTSATLPEDIHIQLRLGEIENGALPNLVSIAEMRAGKLIPPQIWILPGGEVTPFILEFYDDENRLIQRLTADTVGNLALEEFEL
ncbi:type II secretion system minor pseudopilin GspH [Thorsellia anophelis]|uniref:Type II secretion system protein H n=1 Tax=Thorsellia anophelis DSM 18579 TaxID=1123402 RepID=A0A1I0AXJ5_9GAMM|nr:type II secretion system minor pseudopilin GspH [Thorsellia anophelis]SES98335.1 type II secretion system protein H [Thorsellia anophelis DSM 18579]